MQGQGMQRRRQPPLVTASAPASPHRGPSRGDGTDRYLDAGEVACIVGVKRETIQRAWRSGHLSGYATNRKVVRFTRDDVEEWLNAGRRNRSASTVAQGLRPSPRSRPRRKAA